MIDFEVDPDPEINDDGDDKDCVDLLISVFIEGRD